MSATMISTTSVEKCSFHSLSTGYEKIHDKAFKNSLLPRAVSFTYFQVLTTAGALPLRRDRDGERGRRGLYVGHLHYG